MYKVRVSKCMTGVISSNQGWTHVEMSVRFKFLLDFPCIVMTEAKLPTVIREFRQLNSSKYLDLPFFHSYSSGSHAEPCQTLYVDLPGGEASHLENV